MHVAEDLREAARHLDEALRPELAQGDWSIVATPTDWSCRDTLDHIGNALCSYATSLANRFTERPRSRTRDGDATASPGELLSTATSLAGVLAAVAEGAPPGRRAFHPAGMADRDGFVAMGCDEVLVHGHDIAQAFGIGYDPSHDLCNRIVRRLFPWAPVDEHAPWELLLWANGRQPLSDRPRRSRDWWWHCAPLDEWTGDPHDRSAMEPPGWR